MSETKELIPLNTTCESCLWAEFQGKHQSGCGFGRLERFQKNGGIHRVSHKWMKVSDIPSEMLQFLLGEAYDLADIQNKFVLCEYIDNNLTDIFDTITDEHQIDLGREHSYYKINRFCNRASNKYWAEKLPEGIDPKAQIIKDSAIKVSLVVYLHSDNTLFDLANIINDINYQTLPPHEVIVVYNRADTVSDYHSSHVSDVLSQLKSIKWHNLKLTEKVNRNGALDEAYRKVSGQYFAEITLPTKLNYDFIEQIEISINERLDRWIMAEFDNPNIKVYQKRLVLQMNGNVGGVWKEKYKVGNIEEKIRAMVEEYEQPHQITKL